MPKQENSLATKCNASQGWIFLNSAILTQLCIFYGIACILFVYTENRQNEFSFNLVVRSWNTTQIFAHKPFIVCVCIDISFVF